MGRTTRMKPLGPDATADQLREWWRREQLRQAQRETHGRLTGEHRRLEERTAALAEVFVERAEANRQRPLAERAREYVIVRDDDGQAIGITPA